MLKYTIIMQILSILSLIRILVLIFVFFHLFQNKKTPKGIKSKALKLMISTLVLSALYIFEGFYKPDVFNSILCIIWIGISFTWYRNYKIAKKKSTESNTTDDI